MPDSFSRRTRCSVAAGESPTMRASSTFGRSASDCSSARSRMSTESSGIVIRRKNIRSRRAIAESLLEMSADRWIIAQAMTTNRNAILALAAAGALWGLTVPLSKLSLEWLGGGWLTVLRFALAAPLLAYAGRRGLRAALTPRIAVAGAVGFGAVILLQNAGIERTSVSHAALVVGAVPVMVALMAAGLGHGVARPTAWAGYGLALAGIAMVAGGGGSGSTLAGDGLVFASVALSATFIVIQPRLLAGRDPAAVTAVQFGAGALVAVPHALAFEGLPAAPATAAPVAALAALAFAGTLLPFWLFAYGQAHVSPGLAGGFLNLEPLVGVAVGWVGFGEAGAGRPPLRGVAVPPRHPPGPWGPQE